MHILYVLVRSLKQAQGASWHSIATLSNVGVSKALARNKPVR
jgi:hypothetical protein